MPFEERITPREGSTALVESLVDFCTPLRSDYAEFMLGNDDGDAPICDLGVMGCNEVPMEFRRNMQALEVGATIEFVVRDPSAKEDLPPLARMMGHRIISEEHLGDGALSIVIERAR